MDALNAFPYHASLTKSSDLVVSRSCIAMLCVDARRNTSLFTAITTSLPLHPPTQALPQWPRGLTRSIIRSHCRAPPPHPNGINLYSLSALMGSHAGRWPYHKASGSHHLSLLSCFLPNPVCWWTGRVVGVGLGLGRVHICLHLHLNPCNSRQIRCSTALGEQHGGEVMADLWSKTYVSHTIEHIAVSILDLDLKPETQVNLKSVMWTIAANSRHVMVSLCLPNNFPLSPIDTCETTDPAAVDGKCGGLVGKEILPGESWCNHTHLHKHNSVLADMCFINNLRLNSDTFCPDPIPHINSCTVLQQTSTLFMLAWLLVVINQSAIMEEICICAIK